MDADEYWQAAEQRFEDDREHQHRVLNQSDGPYHQAGNALGRSGVQGTATRRRVNPWEIVNDRYWFDKPAIAITDDDDESFCTVVFDLDNAGRVSTMHVVAICGFCGQTCALDPPFTDLASLWEARQFGIPVHHTCRNHPGR